MHVIAYLWRRVYNIAMLSFICAIAIKVRSKPFVKFTRQFSLPRDNLEIGPNDIIALDFDGVLCASSGESSYSAVLAACKQWPVECGGIKNCGEDFARIQKCLSIVRPIIETGFENLLLARYFSEYMQTKNCDIYNHARELLQSYNPRMRDSLLLQYGTPKRDLIDAFGRMRDELIASDLQAWLSLNEIYPHVKEAFQPFDQTHLNNLYIVTTKQERFVKSILASNLMNIVRSGASHSMAQQTTLEANGIVPTSSMLIHMSNIFDLENQYGPKLNVLCQISQQVQSMQSNGSVPVIHFIEDRYETLLNIQCQLRNNARQTAPNLRLYLADWGYNTASQQTEARENPDIVLISDKSFLSMMTQYRSHNQKVKTI